MRVSEVRHSMALTTRGVIFVAYCRMAPFRSIFLIKGTYTSARATSVQDHYKQAIIGVVMVII